jgi:hypothetical protein
MNRRTFITTASMGALAATPFANVLGQVANFRNQSGRISQLKKNTAIAMWDFSWILRHHPGGSFEHWEQVLEGLALRGYDSIRMDCMPQFVAADTDGRLQEAFTSVRNPGKRPVMWGNDQTMTFRPREALLEFLPLCKKYGIKVGLSSWFMRHGVDRAAIFSEEGGLRRAWMETLTFLDKNGLLDENVMYVDLLNEYPDWHGYDWLKQERAKRSDLKQFKADNPDAHLPDPDMLTSGRNNPVEKEFYNDYVSKLVREVRAAFPQCDYFASISSSYGHVDISEFAALDRHIWFNGRIPEAGKIGYHPNDIDLKEKFGIMRKYWEENRQTEIEWMDTAITAVAEDARKHGVVCGNTEGWGTVGWHDHPDLDWRFHRETAEICVDLCLKHDNYRFICTSNFTHPHFGFWDDIKWHQNITAKIKNARI